MISREPLIDVGILEGAPCVTGRFEGAYRGPDGALLAGGFRCVPSDGGIALETENNVQRKSAGSDLLFEPADAHATVRLDDVTIGVQFHWERKEQQVFTGALRLLHRTGKGITAINRVPLEDYLASVISSEMSATAPGALLRAHAITSRSWLVAMLERAGRPAPPRSGQGKGLAGDEVIAWYTREDHTDFDVCADDHCQRYQGVTKIISASVAEAMRATRGQFLVYGDEVCDARFFKACGGRTEEFASAWEPVDVPYLRSVSDAPDELPVPGTEEDMRRWIENPPHAYCNTTDPGILKQILPSFDQETTDFFRWTVRYEARELSELVRKKSGIDLGTIRAIVPLRRGPSGRITLLRLEGEQRTVRVGKELEIRRWLSPSHLYSSAFIVDTVNDGSGKAREFILRGAGWGHGVGLCQIGAAVMATLGMSAEEIVLHYFRGASLRTLY